ncbi:hypothetical protein, conserved [Eimeria tenella]|uniref:Uncharacterized protein n=1 Tax=Eimeria tenella TaxID=5802 RepID=U6KK69_EIMTE|nr:hypothetical protein, conserved [Eimeria tenella]CDJ37221.1 hypothetical protein, conserved [Eimeria tenella]|eukprot:XP_013228059.1 hypothetical protein, conserved [Eimeria tenella]
MPEAEKRGPPQGPPQGAPAEGTHESGGGSNSPSGGECPVGLAAAAAQQQEAQQLQGQGSMEQQQQQQEPQRQPSGAAQQQGEGKRPSKRDSDIMRFSSWSLRSSSSGLAEQMKALGARAEASSSRSSSSSSTTPFGVVVAGSGRLRLMQREDSLSAQASAAAAAVAAAAAAGAAHSPRRPQQQQQQQQGDGAESVRSSNPSPRLSASLFGHSASLSVAEVAVAPGQEGLAEIFWKPDEGDFLDSQLSGFGRRRAQFALSGSQEESLSNEMPEALVHDIREAAGTLHRPPAPGHQDWQFKRRQSFRRVLRPRGGNHLASETLDALAGMNRTFLGDIYEELQEQVSKRREQQQQQQEQQQQQQQQQEQRQASEPEVYEIPGMPPAPQPSRGAGYDAGTIDAGSEALLMEVSFEAPDLDLAFERFAGAQLSLDQRQDDDLRQLQGPPKFDRMHTRGPTEKKESPRSRLARLRLEVPQAVELLESLCAHADESRKRQQQHGDSSSGAAYVLSLNEALAEAAHEAETTVREGVAADTALQQVLFKQQQPQQQQQQQQQQDMSQPSLLNPTDTGGLLAPLYCPTSCVEMDTLAREAQEHLQVPVQQQQKGGGSGSAIEVLDAVPLTAAAQGAAARRLLLLEERLKRLEQACLPAAAANRTEEPEVLRLATQWEADSEAPTLAELASRLHQLLSLAADPSPLSQLSARLSVVRCCLDEQEQQQEQQEQQQRQQQRWQEERGTFDEEDFSEFLPEKIVLSLHQQLAPCKTLADNLPQVTQALSQAKVRFASIVSLLEAMSSQAAQQKTLQEKLTSLQSIAAALSGASAAQREAEKPIFELPQRQAQP